MNKMFKKYSPERVLRCNRQKRQRIQQTIPSQYIYAAELDAALDDPFFLPTNNIAIFLNSQNPRKILEYIEYFKKEWI